MAWQDDHHKSPVAEKEWLRNFVTGFRMIQTIPVRNI